MANEKRLIDANALIKEANAEGAYEYVDAKQIADAPTIDAVEVVRCRECKHAWIHPGGYVYCNMDGRSAHERIFFNLDSFCSYGERNDGDGNG